MTLDDTIELDTYIVTNTGKGWVKYHWPEYRGKRCSLSWSREQCRFAQDKTAKPLACVNRLLKAEGII